MVFCNGSIAADANPIDTSMRIEMAPLQGLTGYVFREVYSRHFIGVDHSYCPFVRLRAGQLLARDKRELAAGLVVGDGFTPQIIAASPAEASSLCALLVEQGHRRVNLNLGCPYPMETKRKKGAGLLPRPEEVEKLLEILCRFEPALKVSVKTRLGLEDDSEFSALVPIFNAFPLSAIIIHPRTAKQMYSGTVAWDVFEQQAGKLTNPVIANGDLLTIEDAQRVQKAFPWIAGLMIGRGLLRDPFLPAAIKGLDPPSSRRQVLGHFHDELVGAYSEAGISPGHIVDKMRGLWAYLAHNFADAEKLTKRFRRIRDMDKYQEFVGALFRGPRP